MNTLNPPARNRSQPLETTVTFLHMQNKPATREPLPVNTHAALMRLRKPPLHFYRYIYFQVGYRWDWEIRLRMSDEELRGIIHADHIEVTVLYLDGSPAGFFEINRKDPFVTDLAYFGMTQDATGRGLGRWFLSAAIHAAWDNNPEKITVNTCTLDHPAALPLYQKMGFEPIRQAQGHVRPLNDTDLARLALAGIRA